MDSKYFGFPANPPPNFHMWSLIGLAEAIELVGSLLLLVGLYSREAAFMSGEIAVAYFMRRAPNGFFPSGQCRRPRRALFCFVFLFLLFAVQGPWSVDAVRPGRLRPPELVGAWCPSTQQFELPAIPTGAESAHSAAIIG